MKYLMLALLLGLRSDGLVSTNSRHVMLERNYEKDSTYQKIRQCRDAGSTCGPSILKWEAYAMSIGDILPKLRQTGATQVCSDFLADANCTLEQFDLPVCRGVPKYFGKRQTVRGALDAGKHICINKFRELEQNWDCLLSIDNISDLLECRYKEEFWLHCRTEPVLDCVVDLYTTNPNCGAGAENFIRELGEQYLQVYGPQCGDNQAVYIDDAYFDDEYIAEFLLNEMSQIEENHV